MGGEWQLYKIEEIAERTISGPFGSNIRSSEYVQSGIPLIRGFNLSGSRFNDRDYVFVTKEKAQFLSSSIVLPKDVVFVARGTVGLVGLVPATYAKYVLSPNLVGLRLKPDVADPYYVFYYFRSHVGQNEIYSYVSTTGVPKIARALESLRNFRIFLPPLPEQRAIAHILGTLDDKIELNQRMNETLEAIAQAIFKSWFVDFDPVVVNALKVGNPIPDKFAERAARYGRPAGRPYNALGLPEHILRLFPDRFQESELGPIPEGWEVKSLDQIAHFQNGLALQKYRPKPGEARLPVVKIAQLRTGRADGSEWASPNIRPECIIDDGDVVFSWSGSLLVKIWCGGRAALNQHLFKVTSREYPKWFYYGWIQEHLLQFVLIASDKATTMGHIRRHHLSEAGCVVPDRALLEEADALLASLLEGQIRCELESRTLATLRDTLLPKLISGELRVPDVEKILEEKGA